MTVFQLKSVDSIIISSDKESTYLLNECFFGKCNCLKIENGRCCYHKTLRHAILSGKYNNSLNFQFSLLIQEIDDFCPECLKKEQELHCCKTECEINCYCTNIIDGVCGIHRCFLSIETDPMSGETKYYKYYSGTLELEEQEELCEDCCDRRTDIIPTYTYRVGDIFSGSGGMRIGLENHPGFSTIFSIEKDSFAVKNYNYNFNTNQGSVDIRSIKEIPDLEILLAGFSCIPFANGGKKLGFDDPVTGDMFFETIRLVKTNKPAIIVFENVYGILNHKEGKTFEKIIQLIVDTGYTVFWSILKSNYFDLPQARKRVFIVCFRKDLNIKDFTFPNGFETNKCISDILIPSKQLSSKFYLKKKIQIDFKTQKKRQIIKILNVNPSQKGQNGNVYSSYGYAPTLTTNKGEGIKIFDQETSILRRLTPRETARLQGFPESYKIIVSNSQAYKMFGKAVSVSIMEELSKILYEILENSDI